MDLFHLSKLEMDLLQLECTQLLTKSISLSKDTIEVETEDSTSVNSKMLLLLSTPTTQACSKEEEVTITEDQFTEEKTSSLLTLLLNLETCGEFTSRLKTTQNI